MRCQLVFNPWESRAFIAKAILHHPLVKKYLNTGVISIGRGLTNAFILKELLFETKNVEFQINLNNYVAGVIDGSLWLSNSETRTPEVAFYNGTPRFISMEDSIDDADLILKGANALSPDWVAGVLCAHPTGGTIGTIYAKSISKGKKILVPISTGKLVPYPIEHMIPELGGQVKIDYVRGLPVSLFPIIGGIIFSEIEAFQILAEVEIYPIGAGGIYNGAGAVVFEVYGTTEEVNKIISVYEKIKDTDPLKVNLKPH